MVCPKNWKQKYKTKEKFCKITQELLLLYNFSQIFCQITQQLLLLYTFDGIFLSNQHFISCDIKTKVSLTKKNSINSHNNSYYFRHFHKFFVKSTLNFLWCKDKSWFDKKIPSNHTTTLITLCIFTNFLSNQHCISCWLAKKWWFDYNLAKKPQICHS